MAEDQPGARPSHLNFITGNANKLAEVKAILSSIPGLELESRDVPGDEIQGSIEEIARDKCRRAAAVVGGPVLTEDTALEFTSLKGLPGPYIKHFLSALGHDGLNNLLAAYPDKTATTVCTFGYCAGPGQEPILFQGKTQGKIVPARGPRVFGWDACFEYEGETYAEMDKNHKLEILQSLGLADAAGRGSDITYVANAISHRGKALAKLKSWLAGGDVETL
ncbi:Inosine triphosphate pyrophosphatase [Cyphellophora attinorum]|uniref:Inosine triphosphate pyrophosphatase n=1 Tax=Cyphellophora attinorum TaxID=1664694 RepID=A0A0N0NNL8_9EURO|nr:Inosine triphosphate pyrophosphatase [Phialophora attinorum]KPI41688.1 Inosine triphosphate pyrophosphatase [Phialophora attinorum]